MKKTVMMLLVLCVGLFGSIRVDTTYATMAKVAEEIGGSHVKVFVLGSSRYDPHFIVPKPSLLSKLRRADILIINGAGLELGWLPPLIKRANNPKIQVGAKGFLDLSQYVHLQDVPESVSRAFGDVHAQGNPHYILDPHNIIPIAKAIAAKLAQTDPQHREEYVKNLQKFLHRWEQYLQKYDADMLTCKTKKVVEYHELFNYFLRRYNIKSYGNIEPLPGIAPSSKHTLELIHTIQSQGVQKILQDVYHEKKTARFIADKTGAEVVVIPHEVGSVANTDTLESLYDTVAKRLCQ